MNLIDILLENFKNAEKVFTDEGADSDDLKEYLEKYKEIVKEIISDSSVNNLDEAIMEMENLCLELTIKYKIYDRRFGDIHSLFY